MQETCRKRVQRWVHVENVSSGGSMWKTCPAVAPCAVKSHAIKRIL